VAVKAGDAVAKGQTLLTLEAMKMEYALTAPFDGGVVGVAVKPGDTARESQVLVTLAPLQRAD
jgi:propionyl-CoA carboxylase alpha chain/3-methylcrotonyl-CoA carboxylase alpha subunit